MKLTIDPGIDKNTKIYTLVINAWELALCEFDQFDRTLFKVCDKSNSIADKLLALETIARKVEQAAFKHRNMDNKESNHGQQKG